MLKYRLNISDHCRRCRFDYFEHSVFLDASSTSRSNPVVSLNQETYILLSKQPNKDTSKGNITFI